MAKCTISGRINPTWIITGLRLLTEAGYSVNTKWEVVQALAGLGLKLLAKDGIDLENENSEDEIAVRTLSHTIKRVDIDALGEDLLSGEIVESYIPPTDDEISRIREMAKKALTHKSKESTNE